MLSFILWSNIVPLAGPCQLRARFGGSLVVRRLRSAPPTWPTSAAAAARRDVKPKHTMGVQGTHSHGAQHGSQHGPGARGGCAGRVTHRGKMTTQRTQQGYQSNSHSAQHEPPRTRQSEHAVFQVWEAAQQCPAQAPPRAALAVVVFLFFFIWLQRCMSSCCAGMLAAGALSQVSDRPRGTKHPGVVLLAALQIQSVTSSVWQIDTISVTLHS